MKNPQFIIKNISLNKLILNIILKMVKINRLSKILTQI